MQKKYAKKIWKKYGNIFNIPQGLSQAKILLIIETKTNSMSREALWRVLNRLWKRNGVKEQAMQHHKTSPCALVGIALIFKKAPINAESKFVSIWGSI